MGKNILNDSQIENASGGGVMNYIKGTVEIAAGLAGVAGSICMLTGNDEKVPYLGEVTSKLKNKKPIGTVAGVASALLVLNGISRIQDENRASNFDEYLKSLKK